MNKGLKEVLFQLMDSHRKLSKEEYKRNITFNSSHFAYKAEENLLAYLEENYPEVLEEYLNGAKEKPNE